MIAEVLFSSATDLWETPQWFFDELNNEFHFTLDSCALPDNAKCDKYYTPEMDGLSQEWRGVVWCNPPYGRDIKRWVRKAYESARDGATVVLLVHARTDTRWFHDYIYGKAEIRFVKGRLKFGGSKHNAPFPSMVCIFRPQTNADRIRSMTDEELANFIFDCVACDDCPIGSTKCKREFAKCHDAALDWLKQETKE